MTSISKLGMLEQGEQMNTKIIYKYTDAGNYYLQDCKISLR